jgi:hypothetical protein
VQSLLSWRLAVLLGGILALAVASGHLLWWFEHRGNPESFPPQYPRGVGEATWWIASTIVTGGCDDKHVDSMLGRGIALIWMVGGIGLIAVNPGIDIHWGTCTTIWGSPDLDDLPRKPKIPVVAVNKQTGEALKAIAAAGGTATIRTEMIEGWYVQKVPEVRIPGAVEPDKFVFVHGHYDSWDVGVGDNATGDG